MTLILGFIMLCVAVIAVWISTALYVALAITACVVVSSVIGLLMLFQWWMFPDREQSEAEAS